MSFLTGVFIICMAGIAAGTIGEIAKAIARRGGSGPKLDELKRQVEQYAAVVEDTQNTLVDQAAQLAELQERVDFAERLLAQARDRIPLEPGRPRQG